MVRDTPPYTLVLLAALVGLQCQRNGILDGVTSGDPWPSGMNGSDSSYSSSSGGSGGSSGDSSSSATSQGSETGGPIPEVCDLWTQDCPAAYKCAPFATDGKVWDSARCVPLDPSPISPGGTCQAEAYGLNGSDNCAAGSMCYFVFGSQGACVELCSGSPDSPSCSGGSVCRIDNDGFLPLCLPRCDPLQQDCPEHATCLVDEDARVFTCLVDASVDGGHVNQPCTHVNGCKPGLFCAPSDLLPQCDGDPGCCTNYCDVTAQSPDDACQVADTQCLQWFREPPAEYDHVGGCIQPIIP